MAGSAFLTAWQRGGLPLSDRQARYAYYQAWEDGTVFAGDWTNPAVGVYSETLRAQYRLYRWTRLVWNPVPDLNDFWGSVIYPGVLLRRAEITGGRVSALPLNEGIDPALHDAIDQILWWSGFGWLKYVIPYWAAIDGNLLLKLVDDVPGAKVYMRPVRAGLVADLTLNAAGDVLFVATEEKITPAVGDPYIYREEISRAYFRTLRDGKEYDFSGELGLGAVYPNTWGFVPACWVPFQPTGTAWAAPAIGPALPELLEINSLQSMLDDGAARGMNPIPVFITTGNVSTTLADKRAATGDLDPADAGRESVTAFRMKDGSLAKLDPSGNVADISAYLTLRKQEFYRHYPELSMWESLRARNVSGVAAEILHGDTRNKVLNIRPGIDRQVEKALQMAITMAGTRYPAWGRPTDARRRVFAPFSASSWDDGKLTFSIAERPLVPVAPLTAPERAALADVLLNKLGLPRAYVYEQAGVPEAVITAMEQQAAQADQSAPPAAAPGPALQAMAEAMGLPGPTP